MKTWTTLILVGLLGAATAFAAGPKAALKKLSAIKKGFFYSSESKGDGVTQLSKCASVRSAAAGRFKKLGYQCAREKTSYRCTLDASLDVVFVFDSLGDCEADRKKTLDSPED